MATPLRQSLLELDRRLRAQGVPARDLLVPGRDRGEVTALLEETFADAPDDLVTWFSWCDGVGDLPPAVQNPLHRVVIGRWRPYSLSESLSYFLDGPQWAAHPRDGRSWLPLVDGLEGQGQGKQVLMAAWRDPQRVAVVKGHWGGAQVYPVADSMQGLVSGWLSVFDDGLRWDTDSDTWATPEVGPERSQDWQRVL